MYSVCEPSDELALTQGEQELWDASISPQTALVYKTSIEHFLRFVTLQGICTPTGRLPVINEDLLIKFVTYCHKSLALKFTTIKLYLSGIRFNYLKYGFDDPLSKRDRLECILRGIKRMQGTTATSEKRYPVTFDILKQFVMYSLRVFYLHTRI